MQTFRIFLLCYFSLAL